MKEKEASFEIYQAGKIGSGLFRRRKQPAEIAVFRLDPETKERILFITTKGDFADAGRKIGMSLNGESSVDLRFPQTPHLHTENGSHVIYKAVTDPNGQSALISRVTCKKRE